MRRRVAVLLAIVTSLPTSARAADKEAANALLREGGDLFLHEDYEGARAAFGRAYDLDPKAATLFNLALSELNSDHPLESVAHLREYLTHTEEPAAKLASVRTKWLPRAEARTARLDLFAPPGSEWAVDGVPQGEKTTAAPAGAPTTSIVVAAGEHDVSARHGTLTETQHVTARGGELLELHFQRVADAPPPSLAIGSSGKGETEQRADGGAAHAKGITVVALGSAALVAAGAGVGLGIYAASDADDGSRGFGTASVASYIGAGALGAASIATWIFWKPKPGALAARPVLGSQGAGVILDGRW